MWDLTFFDHDVECGDFLFATKNPTVVEQGIFMATTRMC
jgi:hypothetical protein